jgi:hypothetical protein
MLKEEQMKIGVIDRLSGPGAAHLRCAWVLLKKTPDAFLFPPFCYKGQPFLLPAIRTNSSSVMYFLPAMYLTTRVTNSVHRHGIGYER